MKKIDFFKNYPFIGYEKGVLLYINLILFAFFVNRKNRVYVFYLIPYNRFEAVFSFRFHIEKKFTFEDNLLHVHYKTFILVKLLKLFFTREKYGWHSNKYQVRYGILGLADTPKDFWGLLFRWFPVYVIISQYDRVDNITTYSHWKFSNYYKFLKYIHIFDEDIEVDVSTRMITKNDYKKYQEGRFYETI